MYHFYAVLSRMKYIHRWALMRNTREENLSEHSLEVAFITHALCMIKNKRLNGTVNEGEAVLYALYHDVPEIITGDLPTPVKYYSADMKQAYQSLEQEASAKLCSLLPNDFSKRYFELMTQNKCSEEIKAIVKAADKISAVIKCIEEEKAGNKEFIKAKDSILGIIREINLPEVSIFMQEFLAGYELTLDELTI